MKTIVIANHKGGCAETTTALNLAVVMASQGSRVLAVDRDRICSMTSRLVMLSGSEACSISCSDRQIRDAFRAATMTLMRFDC
jgi:cellulose biosynthesis protein BcsQ